ncbi:MAG: hypothetical protein HKN36_08105 [Hellea sp.]|nr:hypothetical protein [Hellea sp.]
MGHHPGSAAWRAMSGNDKAARFKLTDKQCEFINNNAGVSRQTLRDVCGMLNAEFGLNLSYEAFVEARATAIEDGRCRTTYLRNYFKSENSSERQLRQQRALLRPRLSGGCQYLSDSNIVACGKPTSGRFCETHVRQGHRIEASNLRGQDYIDSTLGKYG